MCQTAGLPRCFYSGIKRNMVTIRIVLIPWELIWACFCFFLFFFLLKRSVGSRFLGATSIESLVCPSSPGQPAWSRAGTSSPGQSKGRTGLLAFPERAHWWTFYRESFNVPLILFPFLVLNSLHRKRHGYLVLWIREWSRSCWMKKTQPFLSDEVYGGYCALSSSYSRSQSPALHTLAEDRLLNRCWNLPLRCPGCVGVIAHTLVSSPGLQES